LKVIPSRRKHFMRKLIDFFVKTGKLKDIPRRGWVLRGIKNPGSISDHLFRVAMMAWILGREKKDNLSIAKVIKIALVHDLCELYAGDTTPYDKKNILPEDKRKWPEILDKWPRFSKEEKKQLAGEKHQKEEKGLDKIIEDLPLESRNEIKGLWLEYEAGLTAESRFVKQINRLETLLQALEYGKEDNQQPSRSWWIEAKEIIDDPSLVSFMEALDKSFHFFEEDDAREPVVIN
jgi:putative hydrolase of HD superfamily